MSDYYYFEDKEDDFGFTPILGEDYIRALLIIAKKHGIKITDEMILDEVWGKQSRKQSKIKIRKSHAINI